MLFRLINLILGFAQTMAIPTADIFQKLPNLASEIACISFNQPICLNQGLCVDWALLQPTYKFGNEECLCRDGFYGPRCEYSDEVIEALEDLELTQLDD